MVLVLCIAAAEQALAFYNPGTGRWLSKDPAEEAGGINLYSCCVNNAINKTDAFGLSSFDVDARSEAVIATLYSDLRPKATEFIIGSNEKLAPKCEVAKVTQGLRTTTQQNNIPSANTRARGNTSYHVWGLAFDIDIFRHDSASGKDTLVQDSDKTLDPTLRSLASIVKGLGLQWGGDFTTIYDPGHYQWNLGPMGIQGLIALYNKYGNGMSYPAFAEWALGGSFPLTSFPLSPYPSPGPFDPRSSFPNPVPNPTYPFRSTSPIF
jgi:hypothetical protein